MYVNHAYKPIITCILFHNIKTIPISITHSIIYIFYETRCILTTILNVGNVQCFIRSCNIIFKLLMTLVSLVMMIINSINTGTM